MNFFKRVHAFCEPAQNHSLFTVVTDTTISFSERTDMCDAERIGVTCLGSAATETSRGTKLSNTIRPHAWTEGLVWDGLAVQAGPVSIFSESLAYAPTIGSCGEGVSGFHRKEPAWDGNQRSQEYAQDRQGKVLIKSFTLYWLPSLMNQEPSALPPHIPLPKSIFKIH